MELVKQMFEYGFAAGALVFGFGLALALGGLILLFLWECRP